jgi:hypothetical protein
MDITPYFCLALIVLSGISLVVSLVTREKENAKLRQQIIDLAMAIAPLHEIKQGNLEAARLMLAANREAKNTKTETPSAGAPEKPQVKAGLTITQFDS